MSDVEQAKFLRELAERQARPAWRDLVRLMAQEKFAKFSAYRAAGFDAKQALELVIRENGV